MQFHKQRFVHDPANGSFGDCDRAVMACLLDMSPDDVPHWGVHYDNPTEFNRIKTEWHASLGLFEHCLGFECSLDEMKNNLVLMFPGIYVTLTGTSATGCHHVVITLNGEIIHDTSLTDSGIVLPCDTGRYYVGILLPLFLKETR